MKYQRLHKNEKYPNINKKDITNEIGHIFNTYHEPKKLNKTIALSLYIRQYESLHLAGSEKPYEESNHLAFPSSVREAKLPNVTQSLWENLLGPKLCDGKFSVFLPKSSG